MYEELQDINAYLSIKNESEEERRYLTGLYSQYITATESGSYHLALFAYHLLFMSYVYQTIYKIKEWCPQDIICSTAHSFKGKESDVIIVVDANRGNYPKIHPDNELMELLGVTMSKVLDEERRLFYVAITRATEELYMLYEEEIGHSDFAFPERWQYLSI